MLKADLQRIFSVAVLGEDAAVGRGAGPTYQLDGLLDRGFAFPTDPRDGVEEVRIRGLRLALQGQRRVTLEANPKGRVQDLYDMIDEYLTEKCLAEGCPKVTQASFQFRLASPAGKRARLMTFEVTYPESCSLKSLAEEERLLGEKYLARWGIALA